MIEEVIEVHWTHWHVYWTSLRWSVFCDMAHFHPGSDCQFLFDLSHQHGISDHRTATYWMFFCTTHSISTLKTILSRIPRRWAVSEIFRPDSLSSTTMPLPTFFFTLIFDATINRSCLIWCISLLLHDCWIWTAWMSNWATIILFIYYYIFILFLYINLHVSSSRSLV